MQPDPDDVLDPDFLAWEDELFYNPMQAARIAAGLDELYRREEEGEGEDVWQGYFDSQEGTW